MPRKPGLTVEEQQKIKALVAMGKTYHAIAKEIGRDAKTVKKFAILPESEVEITEKKKELVEFYEDLARRMLDSITDADIVKINAYQRTVSAGIATDKMRLLSEKSTGNIALLIATIEDLQCLD